MQPNIFINSVLTDEYWNLINNARENAYIPGKTEKHHIIPKSCGGNDHITNLVNLSYSDHFQAHILLSKITVGENKAKMCYALWNLANVKNKNQENRYIPNIEEYNLARLARESVVTSDITRKKISAARKNKIAVYNPYLDNLQYINYSELTDFEKLGYRKGGKPKTNEHKLKISETNKRKGIVPKSIGWNLGLTKHTSSSVKEISEKRKGSIPHNKGKSNKDLYGIEAAERLKIRNMTKDAIPVTINGVSYPSIIEASRQLKITERKVKLLRDKNDINNK
jgi:hypothetical protein